MTSTLKEAFYFFRHNLYRLMMYTLTIGVMVVVLPQLFNSAIVVQPTTPEQSQQTIQPLVQILNLIIQPIYFGGLIMLIYSLAKGENKTIANCLMASLLRWPQLFLSNILTTLMVVGGLALFILPGIWLFSRLFLVPFLVLLRQQSPIQAISNSFQHTRGYSLTILSDIFFLVILFVVVILLLNMMQLLHPIILLIFILIFQSLANVIYYRHYEILLSADNNNRSE